MKKTKINSWIPFLMGLSQVLLTGFVIYWLIGQYKAERENLHTQLLYSFMEAQNEAMDSTLYGYLHLLLKDSLFSKDSSNSIGSVHLSARYTTGMPFQGNIVKISHGDSSGISLKGEPVFEIKAFPQQDVLLKGVKMIIQMSTDSLNFDGHNGMHRLPEVDSLLLLNLISGRLKDIDYNEFNVVWYQDSLFDPGQRAHKRIRFQSNLSHPAMVYEVANFEPLLLRAISAQILFAIFLLLLTASSFLMAFKSLKRQKLLNTLRNEFISNVSHELKTPVSTVKVALEALQSYDLKNDAKVSDEYLKMASLEMDRLDLLIQKILDQSLLESEQVVINRQKSDLIELSKAVIHTLKPRVQSLNGSLELEVLVENAEVQIDYLFIQGVLINLLDNALKYGGDPPGVIVRISKETDKVVLSVLDNGNGIAKEFQEKVFERFFRVPTGDKHNIKGYGLGLSFAAQVMKQHEGSIDLKINQSGGCIFTLFFQDKNEA